MPSRAQIQRYRQRLAMVVAMKIAQREREATEIGTKSGRNRDNSDPIVASDAAPPVKQSGRTDGRTR